MKARKLYNTLAIILGYSLIIAGFLIFCASLETRLLILDIIVACLLFTNFVEILLFPLVNLDDASHKEVGMLGVHIAVLSCGTLLSIAIVACGIIFDIPFKYQLFGQLTIVFLLLMGRVATLRSGEKVVQQYNEEQKIVIGKRKLRSAMDEVIDEVSAAHIDEPSIMTRLRQIQDDLRYIAPSQNSGTTALDNKLLQTMDKLKMMTCNTMLKVENMATIIDELERLMAKRKSF